MTRVNDIKVGDKVRFLTGRLYNLSLDSSRLYGYVAGGVYEVLTVYSHNGLVRLKASSGLLDGWNARIEDVELITPYKVEDWTID